MLSDIVSLVDDVDSVGTLPVSKRMVTYDTPLSIILQCSVTLNILAPRPNRHHRLVLL